ncbi:hypothetical protein THAR02_09798 [Trichoderma harzianum]|uniref:Uncharacterized protein n=1 Tax=Trichoderma harzianum TaxID=5544 RepID=A0A0F9ZCD8_TRIHA|nr:hypothetical protein THAR02_09798 [Trichoderma harzianum]
MMLTIKQQSTTYGYKSVHDLPTPPSTSRPSPPLNYQDPSYKSYLVSQNSPVQPMSTSHRGLPPPAAMTLPPQQPPSVGPPPSHHAQPPPPLPLSQPSHQAQQPWPSPSAGLPPPPQQWQGAEESMRTWLQAKTEEEKTRQEEERTRQETLRLEQRKIEMDILRASLGGGIPPPMVPLVFAGMGSGGTLPQAALEWAQQFMAPAQGHHPQLLPPQRPHSPDHSREPVGHGMVYATSPAQVTSAQGPGGYGPYPGSPTRPRGQTVSGAMGRPIGMASNMVGVANPPQPPGQGPPPVMPPYQGHAHTQSQSSQHDTSPSIYFHHWQPPATQSGSSSNRPGTPSGEAQKKRKTTGGASQQVTRAPSEDRYRSPPPFTQPGSSNPASPSRKSHKRQRSDVSWYRPPGQMYGEDPDRPRARTPTQAPSWGPSPREREDSRSAKQSVSSLLSREPDDSSALSRQNAQPPRLEAPPPIPRARGPGEQRAGVETPLSAGEADPRSRMAGAGMHEREA